MEITLVPVTLEEREILANLLEKYEYEFSQYTGRDINRLGLYGYKYLDCYWIEPGRWAYFIMAGGKLAGFAMVYTLPEAACRETDFSLAEFFIMPKYRRRGAGKAAFFDVLRRHRGRWQLMRHPKNLTSASFWDSAVAEFTGGEYELVTGCPGTMYDDGSPGDVYFFESQ